jgi:sensor histidine kinase YesM
VNRITKISLSILIALCLILYGLNWNSDNIPPESYDHLNIIFFVFVIPLVLLVNILLTQVLNIYLDWKSYAGTRFLLQLFLSILLSLIVVNGLYLYIKSTFTETPGNEGQILMLNIFAVAVIIPVISIIYGFRFVRAWRVSTIETERLQKENMRSQMMTLRNHLDPHFLFNNLNTVSSLIDYDTELSKSYLDKFAEVYRIILRTESSDLTTVEDELNMIESYIYLLKIRFQEKVHFKLDVSEESKRKAMLPLSIQMLVENAIKHNAATTLNPIKIEIVSEADKYLVVKNNKQTKKYDDTKRSGTGLKNIRDRYKFFTEEKLQVIDKEDFFVVKIPLLDIEYED